MGIFLGDKPVTVFFNGANASLPVQGVFLGGIQVFPTGTAADPFATLVSTKSTGNVSGTARSTTGYIKVEWWDSTSDVYGTGAAGSDIAWSKAAGEAGSKTLRIYPSDASGNLSGALNTLFCANNSLTSLNVSGCTALTSLDCNNNSLTSLDVSGLTALTELYCNNNSLTSLDVSGCTALTSLDCNNNSLTSLDVSGLTALTELYCNNNSLTSLDVSGFTALTLLNCFNNSLTSLRAVGVVFDNGKWKNKKQGKANGVQFVNNNQLNAAALDQFYTDLGETTPGTGFLNVSNNPGTATHDHTIATNKGYVVFDT
jgi:hypothetical protein